MDIPNEYVPCEKYRGCVIALKHNWYSVFSNGARWPEVYQTRASARRSIDFDLDSRHGRKSARPTLNRPIPTTPERTL